MFFWPVIELRLEVSSSNFPRFDRNLNTGEDQGHPTRMDEGYECRLSRPRASLGACSARGAVGGDVRAQPDELRTPALRRKEYPAWAPWVNGTCAEQP